MMKTSSRLLKKIFLPIAFSLICVSGLAQSTMGTDFWVTFIPGSSVEYRQLSLILSGPRSCSGTIVNPNTSWSSSFNVNANTTTILDIPLEQAYQETSDCIINTGLHIVSSDTISLFASNFKEHSFDVTNVLPTESLGSEYVIQIYPPQDKGVSYSIDYWGYENEEEQRAPGDFSEFTVLAVEDDTQITIQLTGDSANGHYANQPFSISLDAGQCYQLESYTHGDLDGSYITVANNKKVAVFAGNYCVNIPSDTYCCCDHIVEQMMPTTSWGQHFVVTNSMMRYNDVIRVTALHDGCQVIKNGTLLTTLDARQTYQFEITESEPSAYLETSEPAMVFLYFTGDEYGGETGDPSMVIINPIEQKIDNITFSTFNSGASQYHFINVVTETDNALGMQVDGISIASQFQPVAGNSDYSYARVQVNHGSHTISNTDGGFVAHVYGVGIDESYAYSVGSMVKNLTSQLIINGEYSSNYPNGYTLCDDGNVTFELNLNFVPSQVNWNLGDGNTATGTEVAHLYDIGDYEVSCDVYTIDEDDQEILVTTLTTSIHIHESSETYLSEECCDQYVWYGQTYHNSGQYTHLLHTIHGCDSLLILDLTVLTNQLIIEGHPSSYYPNGYGMCEEGDVEFSLNLNYEPTKVIWDLGDGTTATGTEVTHFYTTGDYQVSCDIYKIGLDEQEYQVTTLTTSVHAHESYETHLSEESCDQYVWFGQTYHNSGQYTHMLNTVHGCDSLLIMDLTILNSYNVNLNETACDAYPWPYVESGYLYETGSYVYNGTTTHGCDSIVNLNLTINHTPNMVIHGLNQIAITSDLWPGIYSYCLADSTELRQCDITWTCSNPNWIVLPSNNKYWFNIIVNSLGSATLTATAQCDSGCDAVTTFEINASYLDVDDIDDNTVLMYPNPANDILIIKGNHLKQVTIYDCYGQKLNEIEADAADEITIDTRNLTNGLYITDIITTKGKTTKRLLISK